LPWAAGETPLDDSFAGFVHVRCVARTNASIFYWFFPAQQPLEEHPPLIVWLQGGPGSSSMIGLFYEMGPIRLDDNDLLLRRNPDSWNTHYSMLFIDNPVGTGFSFVDTPSIASSGASGASADPSTSSTTKHRGRRDGRRQPEPEIPEFSNGYAANQAAVAHDLIVFLDKFYEMYPDQLQSRLYITGESYAGKYVPHLAFHIDRSAGSSTRPKIPLAGIAIGNGLTDPITQVSYHAPQALALGLVSRSQAATMQRFADLSVGYICLEEWQKALSLRLRIFDTFRDATGGINWYDVRKGDVPNDWSRMEEFLGLPATKTSLNVGPSAWFGKDPEVYNALQGDVMKSAALVVAYLLDKQYRVVLYQGQFDFRDGIMASSEWIEGLDWHGAEGYATAEREIWRLATPGTDAPPHIVGFSREYANLARVELLHAGHLAPMDQGFVSKRMIDDYLIHATKPVAAPPSTPADPSEP
ncbi:Alpha/Beta hydrolase protein, partial [Entophlyctis helioformis]